MNKVVSQETFDLISKLTKQKANPTQALQSLMKRKATR